MKEFKVLPSDPTVLNLLKKSDRFNKLSESELQLFIKAGKLRQYQPEETIFREGDSDSWAYFLLSGSLQIQEKGLEVGTLKRLGDVFGEVDSLGGISRTATAVAVSKSLVLGIDISFVNEQLEGEQIYFRYMIYRIFAEVQAVRLRDQIEENERLKAELNSLKKGKKTPKKNPAKGCKTDLKGKKILLVDHKESTRRMLKTILTRELNCNKIFEVGSCDNALNYLSTDHVDLVIAELDMPKMSSMQLLDQVKNKLNVKDVPFIIYCADSTSSIYKIKQAADEDITHYKSTQCIILPFTANTVIDKVKKTFLDANKKS